MGGNRRKIHFGIADTNDANPLLLIESESLVCQRPYLARAVTGCINHGLRNSNLWLLSVNL